MKNPNNLFRLRIVDITYKNGFNKNINHKTTCIIRWVNPITGYTHTTKASTVKHPDDENNFIRARMIAESRAKIAMWKRYQSILTQINYKVIRKHDNLIEKELKHINNKFNNFK